MRGWIDAINTAQVLYSNLENGIIPPPSPDLSPFNPPMHPFISAYASRELLLSPRNKSTPNSPFLPVRSPSQPLLPSQLPPLSPRGVSVSSTLKSNPSTSFSHTPSLPVNANAHPPPPPTLRLSLQRNKPPLFLRSPSMQLVNTPYDNSGTTDTNNTHLNNSTNINNTMNASNININNNPHAPNFNFASSFGKPSRLSRRGLAGTQRTRAISMVPIPGIHINPPLPPSSSPLVI